MDRRQMEELLKKQYNTIIAMSNVIHQHFPKVGQDLEPVLKPLHELYTSINEDSLNMLLMGSPTFERDRVFLGMKKTGESEDLNTKFPPNHALSLDRVTALLRELFMPKGEFDSAGGAQRLPDNDVLSTLPDINNDNGSMVDHLKRVTQPQLMASKQDNRVIMVFLCYPAGDQTAMVPLFSGEGGILQQRDHKLGGILIEDPHTNNVYSHRHYHTLSWERFYRVFCDTMTQLVGALVVRERPDKDAMFSMLDTLSKQPGGFENALFEHTRLLSQGTSNVMLDLDQTFFSGTGRLALILGYRVPLQQLDDKKVSVETDESGDVSDAGMPVATGMSDITWRFTWEEAPIDLCWAMHDHLSELVRSSCV